MIIKICDVIPILFFKLIKIIFNFWFSSGKRKKEAKSAKLLLLTFPQSQSVMAARSHLLVLRFPPVKFHHFVFELFTRLLDFLFVFRVVFLQLIEFGV